MVYDFIYSAEAAPRCKKLVWLAFKEKLPVRSLLFAKEIVENDKCPCCDKDSETAMYALLQCEEAKVGTAMGVVFRNSAGVPQASATKLMEECFEEEIAEAMCYRWALERARELCFSDVIFETDCQQL
ncbi:hypothetical protein LR48_Vigan02g049700 [Vigna angularis]|uniref:RNase H type-1 domain-containing protein n=1 Tax=Phaseolus angularis TaxID=3914 RepID=A0A0L9TVA5_PHAAN|nr:hypothetical protein LR48_Vigan02g049700 [Vigna angularis]